MLNAINNEPFDTKNLQIHSQSSHEYSSRESDIETNYPKVEINKPKARMLKGDEGYTDPEKSREVVLDQTYTVIDPSQVADSDMSQSRTEQRKHVKPETGQPRFYGYISDKLCAAGITVVS